MLHGNLLKDAIRTKEHLSARQLRFLYSAALRQKRYSLLGALLHRSDLPADLRTEIEQTKNAPVVASLASLAPANSPLVRAALLDKRSTVASAAASRLDLAVSDYEVAASSSQPSTLVAVVSNPAVPTKVKVQAANQLHDLVRTGALTLSSHQQFEFMSACTYSIELTAAAVPSCPAAATTAKTAWGLKDLPLTPEQIDALMTGLAGLSYHSGNYNTWRVRNQLDCAYDLGSRSDCPDSALKTLESLTVHDRNRASNFTARKHRPRTVEKAFVWPEGQKVVDEQVYKALSDDNSLEVCVRRVLTANVTDAQFAAMLLCSDYPYRGERARWVRDDAARGAERLFRASAHSVTRAAAVVIAYPFLLRSDALNDCENRQAILDKIVGMLDLYTGSYPFTVADSLACGMPQLLLRLPAAELRDLLEESKDPALRELFFNRLWEAFGDRAECWSAFEDLSHRMKDCTVQQVVTAVLDAVGTA